MPTVHTGQTIYVQARDEGWQVSWIRRMRGVSLHVRHPETKAFAGVFAQDEEAAWEALARAYNPPHDDGHPFWGPDPDAEEAE